MTVGVAPGLPVVLRCICVTGPESTGKTWLARQLAGLLGTAWAPEGSREYAERMDRPLGFDDVGPIAREQMMLAAAASARAAALGAGTVVLDTDLVSTVVYARHYYGAVPAWVLRAEREARADLYLLCDVDVPWVPDGVRDRPLGRATMFARFRDALARRRADTVVVRGDWEARWAIARQAAGG